MGNVCCADENAHGVNEDNAERQPELPFKVNFRQGTFRDRAYGSILGALLGSACGSYSDTTDELLSREKMYQILDMPGGGNHGLAGGQITDDGELTMCLLRAIVEANKAQQMQMQSNLTTQDYQEMSLNTDQIAIQYQTWLLSQPFDIDEAAYKAFIPLLENPRAKVAKTAALKDNAKSLSASALSRITPLAVWSSSLKTEEELRQAVEAETALTHSDTLVHDACFIYCLAIQTLLNHQDDAARAKAGFDHVTAAAKSSFVKKLNGENSVAAWLNQAQTLSHQKNLLNATSQTHNEFLHSKYDARTNPSSLKHGFILAFYFLSQAESRTDYSEFYDEAVSQTIQLGGHTDANAAIVGGLVGALIGVNQLPIAKLTKMFSFDCSNPAHQGAAKRSSFLSVKKHAVALIQTLLESRPQKKLVIVEEESPEKSQKNPQERSPMTLEENASDPYAQMLFEMAKGSVKVSYNDFMKLISKKYPKTSQKSATKDGKGGSNMINQYRIEKDIDNGSYGQVKLATNTKDGKTVAIKLIDSEKIIHNNKERHVTREQNLLFSLQHQHIIQIYQTFLHADTGKLCFVFEYCQHGSLENLIQLIKKAQQKNRRDKGGGITEPLARIYMAQLVNTIEYLQNKHVMHRDLKPLNIMIDDNFNLKLIDFGEAKSDKEVHKSALDEGNIVDTFVGTPNYLSPEVIKSDKHTLAIDVWAIGNILYKMLFGKVAFPGRNKMLVYDNICKREIDWPSQEIQDMFISPEAKDLIEGMIQLEPMKRLGGAPESMPILKAHRFFEGIDWEKVSSPEFTGAKDLIGRLLRGEDIEGKRKKQTLTTEGLDQSQRFTSVSKDTFRTTDSTTLNSKAILNKNISNQTTGANPASAEPPKENQQPQE